MNSLLSQAAVCFCLKLIYFHSFSFVDFNVISGQIHFSYKMQRHRILSRNSGILFRNYFPTTDGKQRLLRGRQSSDPQEQSLKQGKTIKSPLKCQRVPAVKLLNLQSGALFKNSQSNSTLSEGSDAHISPWLLPHRGGKRKKAAWRWVGVASANVVPMPLATEAASPFLAVIIYQQSQNPPPPPQPSKPPPLFPAELWS